MAMVEPHTYDISYGETSASGSARVEQIGVKNEYHYENAKQSAWKELGSVDPRIERKRIIYGKGDPLPNSCSWVFEQDSFRRWWDNEDGTNLLWIRGDPGKGKTIIAEAVIQELSKRVEKRSTTVLAYFFCQRADERLNTASAVLRGLLFSLMKQNEDCATYLEKNYRSSPNGSHAEASFWQLWIQFTDLLKDVSNTEIWVCIDAIDECTMNANILLDSIIAVDPAYKVKWIITSRNELHLTEKLRVASRSAHTSLELNSDFVARAVEDYINSKTNELARAKKLSATQTSHIKTYLGKNAQDTFLWVALVFEQLWRSKAVNVTQELLKYPPGLLLLYGYMLQQVKQQNIPEETLICQQILRTVTVVYRPQAIQDLAVLSGIPSRYMENITDLEDLIYQCGSFLTIRNKMVYFVHQSANDYFDTGEGRSIFRGDSGQDHCRIASALIEILESNLRRDMLRVGDPAMHLDKQAPATIFTHIPPSLQYACIHLTQHIRLAKSSNYLKVGLHDGGNLGKLLKTSLLHWFESLAWLQQLHKGLLGIDELLLCISSTPKLAKSPSRSSLQILLHDAKRLLRQFFGIIEIAPLQVYFSALIFSPNDSCIRKLFLSKEFPHWLLYEPTLPANKAIEGRPIEKYASNSGCFTITKHGDMLASRSENNTIRLRDINSGQITRVFNFESSRSNIQAIYPKALAFGEDVEKLICLYNLGVVVSWNLADSDSTADLLVDQKSDLPVVCAMSENGNFAAFLYAVDRLDIWDLHEKTLKGSFTTASHDAENLYLSPDGKVVVISQSRGYSREIAVLRSLDGTVLFDTVSVPWLASRGSVAVLFSRDSRFVVVRVMENLVVYDTYFTDKEPIWGQNMVGEQLFQPGISFDSNMIAIPASLTSNSELEVEIRDLSNGTLLHSMQEHTKVGIARFSSTDLVLKCDHDLVVFSIPTMKIRCRIPGFRDADRESNHFAAVSICSEVWVMPNYDTIYVREMHRAGQSSVKTQFSDRRCLAVKCTQDGTRVAVIRQSGIDIYDVNQLDVSPKCGDSVSLPRNKHENENSLGRCGVHFSPNGQTLVKTSTELYFGGFRVLIYRTAAGVTVIDVGHNVIKRIRDLAEEHHTIDVEFSSNGELCALLGYRDEKLDVHYVIESFSGKILYKRRPRGEQLMGHVENFIKQIETTGPKPIFYPSTQLEIDDSGEWITWQGKKLLWLPQEVRQHSQGWYGDHSFDSAGYTLAIVTYDGNLLFFGFDLQVLSSGNFMSTRKVELHDPVPNAPQGLRQKVTNLFKRLK